MIPTRKISETIMEYGAPILQTLPENPTKEQFEMAFRIIVSAWNAVVLDEWLKTKKFEKEFLHAIRLTTEKYSSIPNSLLKRKKQYYSTDPRAVGDYWIIENDG